VETKVISGYLSISKKSLDRRWSSRCWLPVSIEAILTVAVARDAATSSATSTAPSNSRNTPRTLDIR
jgi:hypothetical protein